MGVSKWWCSDDVVFEGLEWGGVNGDIDRVRECFLYRKGMGMGLENFSV